MPKETMTPVERWLAVLRREKPDRVPMDYWATDEVTEKLKKHLGVETFEEMCDKLHIDYPINIGPEFSSEINGDEQDSPLLKTESCILQRWQHQPGLHNWKQPEKNCKKYIYYYITEN